MKLTLSTDWQDSRFTAESDWLKYTDKSLSNESTNYLTISSDNIEEPEFKATVVITCKTELTSASISFVLTIEPDATSKRVNVYVPPPKMRLIAVDEDSVATLHFDSPLMPFDKSTDAFIMDPARYLHFEIEKNPFSQYIASPEYMNYGDVLSVKIKSFK